jgi:hypothetical protein
MISNSNGTISAAQYLRLIGPDDLAIPLAGEVSYNQGDPYAVTLSLDTGTGEPVMWTFARDLLAAALHAPEGDGDVRAWPSLVSADPADDNAEAVARILTIVLGPPDACARFEASAPSIAAFLTRTYELVPGGQEAAHLNYDAELTELLSQA